MDFLLVIASLLTGSVLVYVWLNKSHQASLEKLRSELETEKQQRFLIQEQKSRIEEKASFLEKEMEKSNRELKEANSYNALFNGQKERNEELEKQIKSLKQELDSLSVRHQTAQEKLQDYAGLLASQKERNDALQEMIHQQKLQFEENKTQLKHELNVLSNSILDEKSKKFTEQNSEQLKRILEPLGIRIDEFKKKVEEVYTEENKERATLKEQIRSLSELNQKMTQEAQNLTKALKGDSKTQGNWGEVILERILEKSGLRKGFEFEMQVSERNEDNRLLRPDVVVKLPDDKFMIVDSKVSLTAYEQWANAETEEQKSASMKAHLVSLRNHIKGLSEKNYQLLYGSKSPDFVLLFIPIQSAFDAAMLNDTELYNEAFNQNIILVSPTTLLATLSTVSSVWKQEYQNRNALEIAEKSGRMYDKFVSFVEDLDKIGKSIEGTQKAYDAALNKLSSGRGNLINQAENLRKLGVKASKKLGDKTLESADLDTELIDDDMQ
jgi:DNA recombination protein RmuC